MRVWLALDEQWRRNSGRPTDDRWGRPRPAIATIEPGELIDLRVPITDVSCSVRTRDVRVSAAPGAAVVKLVEATVAGRLVVSVDGRDFDQFRLATDVKLVRGGFKYEDGTLLAESNTEILIQNIEPRVAFDFIWVAHNAGTIESRYTSGPRPPSDELQKSRWNFVEID